MFDSQATETVIGRRAVFTFSLRLKEYAVEIQGSKPKSHSRTCLRTSNIAQMGGDE